MTESFIDFWRRFNPQDGQPFVHPDDRAWMERHWPEPLRAPVFRSWAQYASSERYGLRDRDLHLSLLPFPYSGDLDRAKVLLFLANAGFQEGDYALHDREDFRRASLQDIHQVAERREPFVELDSRFAWSWSGMWWQARLRPVIVKVGEALGLNYGEALSFVAKKIAVVELFPYRSRDGSRLRGLERNPMPSVQQARKYLARKMPDETKLKLVLRKHALWHLHEAAAESLHFLHGPRLQGISLNTTSREGRAMLEKLLGS